MNTQHSYYHSKINLTLDTHSKIWVINLKLTITLLKFYRTSEKLKNLLSKNVRH